MRLSPPRLVRTAKRKVRTAKRKVRTRVVDNNFLLVTMMIDPGTDSNVPPSDASQLRQMSIVLSAFPWTTDFIVKDMSKIISEEQYIAYVASIAELEEEVNTSQDADGVRLQGALARIMPESSILPGQPNLDKHVKNRVCELLCAYKVIDVIYDLQDPKDVSSYGRPSYTKQQIKDYLPTKLWLLDDWVRLLKNAKSNFDSLGPGDLEHPGAVTLHAPALLAYLKVFKHLYVLLKHHKAIKVLENAQLAACHLACMFVGTSKKTDRLAIPNLPSEAEDWDPNDGLTEDERMFLHQFIKGTGIQKIRHPLYGALLYSPLYLLMPNKLTANSWDQKKMLMLAKALGNEKPAILVTIERLLWRSLLSIASGDTTAHKALSNFFDNVPWDDIAMVSDADRNYFADDVSLPDQKIGLISFDGETNLPSSWPLARLRKGSPSRGIQELPNIPVNPTLASSSSWVDDLMDVSQSATITAPTGSQPDPPLAGGPSQTAPVPSSSRTEEEPPSQYKSERLKNLEKAGKIQKFDEKQSKPRKKKKGSGGKAKAEPAVPTRTPRVRAFMPFQEVEKGVFIQQVRVKAIEKRNITFDEDRPRARVRGNELTIFEHTGYTHSWTPEFHFQKDLDNFMKLYNLAVRNYVKNAPRYISAPETSHVKVLPYPQYKAMSVENVQSLLRDKHLLITDVPIEHVVQVDQPIKFDAAGLQILKNLEAQIPFQDQSIPVENDYSVQLCTGTLEHLLESSRKKDGAILNALSFPLPLRESRRTAHGSDVEAWHITEGLPFCDQDCRYPSGDVHWGLAAIGGALHWIHIDCDGLATVIIVVHGEKWWFLFTPEEGVSPLSFGEIDQFFNSFDVTTPPIHWDVEAVSLRPGTQFIMKPNTPHAVFTTKHTIAVGGHFYSFSNLQQTMFGIVHAFVMDNLITNTEHPNTRVLLFRMLQYLYKFYVEGADPKKSVASHLPSLTTMDGFIDVLTLCNYCILSNVLDPRTYSFPDLPYGQVATKNHLLQRKQHNYNALSPSDRLYFSYVRGLAINLIQWLDSCYAFKEPGKPATYDVATQARLYLHQQVRATLRYKIRADKEKIQGVPNCTSQDLRRQIELLFADGNDEHLLGRISLTTLGDADTLGWDTPLNPAMHKNLDNFKPYNPIKIGTTKGDKLFHKGSALHFPLTSVNNDDASDTDDDAGDKDDDAGDKDDDDSDKDDESDVEKDTRDDGDEESESSTDHEESGGDKVTVTRRTTLGKRTRGSSP